MRPRVMLLLSRWKFILWEMTSCNMVNSYRRKGRAVFFYIFTISSLIEKKSQLGFSLGVAINYQ